MRSREPDSIINLRRVGWTNDQLNPGDRIRILGRPSRHGLNLVEWTFITLPDGGFGAEERDPEQASLAPSRGGGVGCARVGRGGLTQTREFPVYPGRFTFTAFDYGFLYFSCSLYNKAATMVLAKDSCNRLANFADLPN